MSYDYGFFKLKHPVGSISEVDEKSVLADFSGWIHVITAIEKVLLDVVWEKDQKTIRGQTDSVKGRFEVQIDLEPHPTMGRIYAMFFVLGSFHTNQRSQQKVLYASIIHHE